MALISYTEPNNCLDRLKSEYSIHGNLIIGFDFDDTVFALHDNISVNSVVKLLQEAKQLGLTLCLWTGVDSEKELKYKKEICKLIGIEPDYVNSSPIMLGTTKPYFNLLLDDRAGLGTAAYLLIQILDFIKIYNKEQ